MDTKKIHVAGFLLIAMTVVAARVLAPSPPEESVYLASGFGFLSLLSLIFVLAIPIFVKYAGSPLTAYLLANRRWLGIYVFIFALLHVLVVYNFFFGWDVSKMINNTNAPFIALGSMAFLILASMTATSNNASVRILGRNWKRLHMLIYVALAMILVHSYSVGLVFMSNRALSAVVIALAATVVAIKAAMKLAAWQSKQPL
ncbi:MAG: ferric reductase-like transmembrane domain-containing protein [Candidatus Aenigmarchaeota archaeon]|nr:ferric reductase-like transmembrane domain-containing protein [Candidatus Aenigmarchaeota archaeon]